MAEDIEEPQVSEDPFAKYGGKAIEKSEDPFAKYGGKSISAQPKTEQVGGLTAYSDSRQKTIHAEEIKRPTKLTDYTSAPLEMVSKAKATEVSRKPSTEPVKKIATEEKAAAEGTRTNLQLPTTLKGGQYAIIEEPQKEGELQQKLQQREDDKQTAIKNSLLNQGIKPNTQQYLQKERDLNNQISNDNLVVDKDISGEPKLFRSQGFGETLAKTIYNSFKAPVDAYDVNKISDPNQFVQKMQEQTEEESSKPSKILGGGAELIGGVVKPISLLALNAVAGGMGTTAMVAEAYYTALANEKRRLYIAGKQQGLSDVDAAKQAMNAATYTALPDAAMAYVMSGEFGNLPKTVPAVADNTFKNALVKSGKSVLKVSGLGAASEAGKIGTELLEGYKETPQNAIERVWNSATEWGKMDLGFKIVGGIIPAAGYLKAAAKNWLKNVPDELIQLKSEEYGDSGEKIKQSLQDYKNAASNVEGYVPDEHLASFAGKIEKANKLQDDITQKQLDKIGKPEFVQNKIDEEISDIQKQIDGINKEVNTAAKKGVEPKEIDDATGIEAGVEPKINVEPIKTEIELEKQAPEVQQPTETQKPTVEAITEVKPTTEKTETKTIEETTPVVEEVKPTETKEEGGKQFKVNEKEIKIADAERAEAKKLHGLVKNMDAPTDADSIALRYLAEGGKVSQDAINEIAGTVKRARLNTGARELKTSEAKARTYAGGNETLDGLAHRLWENNGQEIPIEDIKQSLMDAINSHNTRLEASKSYLERYSPEYQEQQHWDRIAEEREAEFQAKQADLEKELRNPLDEQIEGEASEEHINNLIKQYEAKFKAENQQLAPEGEGKVTEKVSGREGGEPIEEKGLKKEFLREEKGNLQSQYDSIKSDKAKKNFITKNFGEVSDEQLSDIVKNNTDLQTIKNKIDTIQKSSAGEVLQRKQEGNGSQRGKRGGMEQGKQGTETTTEKNGEENGNGQRVGISHKSLTELADKLGLEQPQTGDVLTPEEYSERGKLLIKNGADPIKAAEEFKKDNKVNSDIISVARAHFNELIRNANDARIKFGINSEEYKKSIKEANDWAKNVVKPMGTAFGEIGRSLQGQVDLDTGNFVSVSMAVQEKTGKDLSTEQTKEVERLTKNVSDLNNKIQDLEKKLTDTISKGEKAEPKAKEGIKEKSKEIANVIRKGKLSRPDIFSSASPASLVWDAAVEITAKTVEVSGDIAQAIADGLEHIKNSDWYKNSDSDKQKAAQKAFRDFVQNQDIKIKFAEKKDNKFTTEEAKSIWEYAKEEYLDKGSDYIEMLNGVSKDLGLNRDQVRTAISQPKGAKEITDEMYRNINKRNNAINEAKQWVEEQGNSKTKNFLKSVPSAFFKLKTFGHGTVGGITHAGTNIFQVSKWKSYFPFFAKQFKYAFGDTAKYEMAMEDLKNDPQFTFWQRAGLAVDPKIKYDDYQGNYVDAEGKVNGIKKLFNRLAVTGDRGFNALKVYRLDLAKGFYDRLSNEEKADPNTAKEIARLVNHSTGTSELDLGRGAVSKFVSTAFFAPKLEASRWQGLIGDPVKAAKTFTNWKEASPAEKAGAKLVARNAGEKIATYVALLAANSALLSLMGSKQKINYTNPLSSDWLKFKTGGGKTLDITGGTLASMKLLGTLIDNTVIGATGTKKELFKKPAEKDYQAIGTQLRYKLSPFASTIADLVETTDAMGRPLPYSNVKPKKGETKYTYLSYVGQQQAPIPVSAGVREAIGSMKERGMTNLQIEDVLMGTLYFTVEGFTGAKLGNEPKKKK